MSEIKKNGEVAEKEIKPQHIEEISDFIVQEYLDSDDQAEGSNVLNNWIQLIASQHGKEVTQNIMEKVAEKLNGTLETNGLNNYKAYTVDEQNNQKLIEEELKSTADLSFAKMKADIEANKWKRNYAEREYEAIVFAQCFNKIASQYGNNKIFGSLQAQQVASCTMQQVMKVAHQFLEDLKSKNKIN